MAGAELLEVHKIWDRAPHNAFTDLVRYRDRWWCVFREGEGHVSPDGALRVLTSRDGREWSSAALLTSPNADLRDAKISVTPGGSLMLTGAGALHQPAPVRHRSLAWFSDNGHDWSEPAWIGDADFWLWRATWWRGVAYSVGYSTQVDAASRITRLYSSPDGKKYQRLVERYFTADYPNEHALAFEPDDTCLCLLRRDNGTATAQLGRARPPYTEWTWQDLGVRIGGPAMIRLRDGTLLAGLRLYKPQARTVLCRLDPQAGRLEKLVTLPSQGDSSYPGFVWHDDRLWMSYYSSHEGKTNIYLAQIRIRKG